MSEPENEKLDGSESEDHSFKENISAIGQKIIGEVEMIGGILTGDPNTAAEGEFNAEVGQLREETEEDLESSQPPHRETPEDEI
ncbi:hypothetical protein BH24ACI3_BH24ACI3_10190 [soil metagenome]